MSLTSQLHDGELGKWCARRMPGTAGVARQVIAEVGPRLAGPVSEADVGRQTLIEAAFVIRVAALVQSAPPYDALRGLVNAGLVRRRWADDQVLLYPSHRFLLIPEQKRALDIRPSVAGWLDLDPAPGSSLAMRLSDWASEEPVSVPARGELPPEPMLSGLFDRIRTYFGAHAPVGQLGTPGAEAGLARLCWLLALFESAGEDGQLGEPVRRMFRGGVSDAEHLHALADGSVVAELAALASGVRDSGALSALRRLAGDLAAGERLGIARPVFAGGWADESVLIGGPAGSTLLGVSTAAAVGDVERTGRWLWRLVACAWLDQAGHYRVREVGLYLARHGTLLTWGVDTLAGVLLGGGDPGAARSEFLELAGPVMAAEGARLPRAIEHIAIGPALRTCTIEETVIEPDPDDDSYYLLDEEERAPRRGWQVVPGGPVCPSRELAELAVAVCERLPGGWSLRCVQAPPGLIYSHYWEVFKGRRGGHLCFETRSSGTSRHGLARLMLYVEAEEAHMAQRGTEEAKPQRSPRVFGPELWRTLGGAEWSHWDMWFCVLCVADHGGDWKALDAVIGLRYKSLRGRYQGPKLAHSADLQKRLTAAGLSAADLAADAAADDKVVAKARTKVIRKTPPESQMSPAMRAAEKRPDPEREWEQAAMYGSWEQFPVSPRGPYEKLMAAAHFDWHVKRLRKREDPAASFDQVAPIEEGIELLESEAADSIQHLLAVRRAALTVLYMAHENYNDSYGVVGSAADRAVWSYSRTDWRRAGISADVFLRDFFGIFTLLDNHGVAHRCKPEILRGLDLSGDLDVAREAITQLQTVCNRDGLGWKAKTLREFLADIEPLDRT